MEIEELTDDEEVDRQADQAWTALIEGGPAEAMTAEDIRVQAYLQKIHAAGKAAAGSLPVNQPVTPVNPDVARRQAFATQAAASRIVGPETSTSGLMYGPSPTTRVRTAHADPYNAVGPRQHEEALPEAMTGHPHVHLLPVTPARRPHPAGVRTPVPGNLTKKPGNWGKTVEAKKDAACVHIPDDDELE